MTVRRARQASETKSWLSYRVLRTSGGETCRLTFPRRGWAALTDCSSPFCNFLGCARSLGRVIPLLTFCYQSTSCTVVNSREWNDSHSTPDNPYHVNKDRDISAIRTDNQASAEDLWLPAGLLENPLRLWKGEPAERPPTPGGCGRFPGGGGHGRGCRRRRGRSEPGWQQPDPGCGGLRGPCRASCEPC